LGSQGSDLLANSPEDKTSRSTEVNLEVGTDRYHRSGSGGIFELYNACNGRLVDGRLDLSRLDELSGEELEALDVTKLRDVARHAAGCAVCERIIRALTLTRAVIRETAGEGLQEQSQAVDVNHVDPLCE
jgi:ribosomal protein S14